MSQTSQTSRGNRVACGIDIGGSGVKGALVDLETGEFVGERVRIDTPRPSTPGAVAEVCRRIIEELGVEPDAPVGITFPAPIVHGTVRFMANLDKSWEGIDVNELMTRVLGRRSYALNDADAAGLAEVTSVPGVGPVYGAIILSEIGDIHRFPSGKQLVSYAGIDATVHESGEFQASQMHISKRGSPYLRGPSGAPPLSLLIPTRN